jgi:hypothetical protein
MRVHGLRTLGRQERRAPSEILGSFNLLPFSTLLFLTLQSFSIAKF